MLPQRPKITVRLPARIYPGDRFEALIELHSKKEQALEFLNTFLSGFETVWHGDNHRSRTTLLPNLPGVQWTNITLKKGKNEFMCHFTLPSNLPPSYQSQRYQIQYEIDVHASIAWWPDAKESFIAKIKAPTQNLIGKAKLAATAHSIQGKEPYVEASLASNVLFIGGYCVGAVSLGNVTLNRYQKISVGLVGLQTCQDSSRAPFTEEVQHRYTELPLGQPTEGLSLPFRFQIPQELSPSFTAPKGKLEWRFEVRASISWKSDCILQIPVALLSQTRPGDAKASPMRAAPPTVGSARVQGIWDQVARFFSLQFKDEQIAGQKGGCEISITREPRTDGFYLVGRLSFPSLHLQLQVQPFSGLGRLFVFSHSIPLQEPKWDPRYQVQAREDAQAKAVLKPLISLLLEFGSLHATDNSFVLEKKDSGQNEEQLRTFANQVVGVAERLAESRKEIPPPESMREVVPVWRQLAQQLSTTLETSRMAVIGSLDGIPCEVITHWPTDQKPLYTELIVRVQIPSTYRQVIELQGAPSFASLPSDAPEIIGHISKDAQHLTLDAEFMSLTFPKVFIEPLALRAEIEALLQLSMLLNSGSGPYR